MIASRPTLLRIDASARQYGSFSRRVADGVQAAWQTAHPNGRIALRDLARQPVAHIQDVAIQGYYTPAPQMTPALRQATALSDTLTAEL